MSPLNRPVTSREYKLMLNVDHFKDRQDGVKDFWKLVRFLVEQEKGEIRTPKNCKKKLYEIEKRQTRYIDTVGLDLRRNNFVLRLREELGDVKEYKLTLKYRSSDRYQSAQQNLKVKHKDKDKPKFEEDIVPLFKSKFSHSASIETQKPFKKKNINTIDDITKWFPGLKQSEIPGKTELVTVNDFIAHEVALKFNRRIVFNTDGARDKKDSVDEIKPCLSFWYLTDHLDGLPLVGEFSFDYEALDMEGKNSKKKLEKFPTPAVIGAEKLFRALQKQENWLSTTSIPHYQVGTPGNIAVVRF